MSAPTDTLRDELALEFEMACAARLRTGRALLRRDSPENRQAWREAKAEVDAVLDMWNECQQDCE